MKGLATKTNFVIKCFVLVALVPVIWGCGAEPTEDSGGLTPTHCTGKCDNGDANVRLLGSLSIVAYESADGEFESFQLVGEVAEAHYFDIEQGATLEAELWAADGASNPDFRIPATLTYEEEGVGAFISDTIDTSELLPYLALNVRLKGVHGEKSVEQTFAFTAGETEGVELGVDTPEPTPEETIDLLANLSIYHAEGEGGESETLFFYADVAEAFYFDVADEHSLAIEVYAADGASNPDFKVDGELVYDEDAVGGYTSAGVDTSLLLPYQLLVVHVTGELNGEKVDQKFEFAFGALEGTPVVEPEEE